MNGQDGQIRDRGQGRIKVLVLDDHRMFAQAIELLLAADPNIELIGAVSTGEEALDVADRVCPDVALVDIDLPGMDGVETTKRILRACPTAQVVVVTAFQDAKMLASAIEAGASGYVPKTRAGDELLDVVHRAAAGEMVLPPGNVVRRARTLERASEQMRGHGPGVERLTTREIEILQILAEGKSTVQVAEMLGIRPFTVQGHVKSVLAKLDVHSKLEAVTVAVRYKLIQLEEYI